MVFAWLIFGQQREEVLGCDDWMHKCVGETQQVVIASDQKVSPTNEGKLEKRDIKWIAAGWGHGSLSGHRHGDAVRQVVCKQFMLVLSGEVEFGVAEGTYQFCCGKCGDERLAAALLPFLAQWSKPTLNEHQCGEYNVCV